MGSEPIELPDEFEGPTRSWAAPRPTVEDCPRLDVRKLVRQGLWPGRRGIYRLGPSLKVQIEVGDDEIVLSYPAQGEELVYEIRLERTPCHYGGARTWFWCPN